MVTPLGHELGVLFGFVGALVISLTVFATWMHLKNKRSARREKQRQIELKEKGYVAAGGPVMAGKGSERVDGGDNGVGVGGSGGRHNQGNIAVV